MNKHLNTVFIRGLEVSACHGVHDFEKVNKKPFVFDADVYVEFFNGAKADDLNGTVSYSSICKLICEVATKNTFNLIEKLAYECAFAVLENFPEVRGIKITVYKPEAPIKQKFSSVGVIAEFTRQTVYLSLGSSEGNRKEYLDEALKKLNETRGIAVKKVSSYIETEPYGGVAQNKFINCAAEVETFLPPQALLEEIHRVEAECGRVRSKRWADRTLDIDIIFYGREIIAESNLIVPHAEYFKRDFVLIPLKEIAPDFVCPVKNVRIRDLSL